MTRHVPGLKPTNFNRLGRPPRALRTDDPFVASTLGSAGLLEALRWAGQADPAWTNEFLVELRQHRRAMNGDRSRPGEYTGDPSLPSEPLPFANREQYRPDRAPGTPDYNLMRTAVENLDAALMTGRLQARMKENSPENGYWARSAPASERPREATEPSLHEAVSAAASLEFPEE
jgi:hypothetical protein